MKINIILDEHIDESYSLKSTINAYENLDVELNISIILLNSIGQKVKALFHPLTLANKMVELDLKISKILSREGIFNDYRIHYFKGTRASKIAQNEIFQKADLNITDKDTRERNRLIRRVLSKIPTPVITTQSYIELDDISQIAMRTTVGKNGKEAIREASKISYLLNARLKIVGHNTAEGMSAGKFQTNLLRIQQSAAPNTNALYYLEGENKKALQKFVEASDPDLFVIHRKNYRDWKSLFKGRTETALRAKKNTPVLTIKTG